MLLAGYSPPGDPPALPLRLRGRRLLRARDLAAPGAPHRARFDRADHVRGWTGLYELSPDNSALLGAVAGLENAYEIHSFSGRGVMQS